MKKIFDFGSGLMMILLLLGAIGYIIASFRFDEGAYFAIGIGCLITDLFIIGFSYIVQAAYMYIEKRNEEMRQE